MVGEQSSSRAAAEQQSSRAPGDRGTWPDGRGTRGGELASQWEVSISRTLDCEWLQEERRRRVEGCGPLEARYGLAWHWLALLAAHALQQGLASGSHGASATCRDGITGTQGTLWICYSAQIQSLQGPLAVADHDASSRQTAQISSNPGLSHLFTPATASPALVNKELQCPDLTNVAHSLSTTP